MSEKIAIVLSFFLILGLTGRVIRLEQNLEALKEWIKLFYGFDLDRMTKTVRDWQNEEED